MAKEKIKKTLTEKRFTRWKVANKCTSWGTYAVPVATTTTYVACNWNNWLQYCNGWQIGGGFAFMLIGVLMTALGVTKYDEIFSKRISKMYYFGLVVMIIGVSAAFLGNMLVQFGWVLLVSGAGLVGGGISSSFNSELTSKKVNLYIEKLSGLGVLKQEVKDDEFTQQVSKDAEEIKSRSRKNLL